MRVSSPTMLQKRVLVALWFQPDISQRHFVSPNPDPLDGEGMWGGRGGGGGRGCPPQDGHQVIVSSGVPRPPPDLHIKRSS